MTGIFYLSHDPGPDAQPIVTPSGLTVYVRVEEAYGGDLVDALDAARPRAGEMLMNTHPLPETA